VRRLVDIRYRVVPSGGKWGTGAGELRHADGWLALVGCGTVISYYRAPGPLEEGRSPLGLWCLRRSEDQARTLTGNRYGLLSVLTCRTI
jgi:hypothetical protein